MKYKINISAFVLVFFSVVCLFTEATESEELNINKNELPSEETINRSTCTAAEGSAKHDRTHPIKTAQTGRCYCCVVGRGCGCVPASYCYSIGGGCSSGC